MAFNQVFDLRGAMPDSTALSESFIRIRGEDMAAGPWRLRVSAWRRRRRLGGDRSGVGGWLVRLVWFPWC